MIKGKVGYALSKDQRCVYMSLGNDHIENDILYHVEITKRGRFQLCISHTLTRKTKRHSEYEKQVIQCRKLITRDRIAEKPIGYRQEAWQKAIPTLVA